MARNKLKIEDSRTSEIDPDPVPPTNTSRFPALDPGPLYAASIAALPDEIVAPLRTLLEPHGIEEFFRRHWDRSALYIKNPIGPDRFKPLLSFEDIWRLFRLNRVPPKYARFFRTNGAAYSDANLRLDGDGLFLFDAVFEFVKKRSGSLVVNHIQDLHPPANRLVHALSEVFRCMVKVNAYFSTKNSTLFPLHWDTHDALILQTEGSKEWHLHEPLLELPLEGRHPSDGYAVKPSRPTTRVTMRPGDVLFVPRGVPHQAFAKASDSLHMTIALYPPTWTTILEALAAQAITILARDLNVRRSSALHLATGAGESASRRYASRLLRGFGKVLASLDAKDVVVQSLANQTVFTCPEEPCDLGQSQPVGLRSTVVRYPCLHFLSVADGQLQLLFDKKQLSLPLRTRANLEFITRRRTFIVEELPELAPGDKIALVTRLVDAGFVHLATAHALEANNSPRQSTVASASGIARRRASSRSVRARSKSSRSKTEPR